MVSDESDTLRWFTLDEYKKLPTDSVRLGTDYQRFCQKWEKLQKSKSK